MNIDEREQTFHFAFNGREVVTVIDYEAPDCSAPVAKQCDPNHYHMGAVYIDDEAEWCNDDLKEIAVIASDMWDEMVERVCGGVGEQ